MATESNGGSVRSELAAGGVLALGLLAVFLVPLHVPVREGISDAYITGFNTRAALLLFGCFSVGFAVWSRGLGLRLPQEPDKSLPRRLLYVTLGITVVVAGFAWMCLRVGQPTSEALYFADRYLMYQGGAHLFRDFEFSYGPLMFYLPVWLHTGTHLSWTESYFAAWMLQWMAGIVVLWKLIGLMAGDTRGGRLLYGLIWGTFLPAAMDGGTNYTPLRFCSALLLAWMAASLYRRGASALPAFGLASLATVLLLFYSPEQGLAFAVATFVFFGLNLQQRKRDSVVGMAGYAVVTGCALWVGDGVGLFNDVKTFSGGAMAFPLVLSLQNVLLLLVLTMAVCGLWGTLRTGGRRDHPLLYLCLIAACLAPSAFSRSDAGHIIINTLGALLTGFLVLMPRRSAATVALWSYFLLIVLLGGLAHIYSARGVPLDFVKYEVAREGRAGGPVRRFYTFGMEKAAGKAKTERMLREIDAEPLGRAIAYGGPLPPQAEMLAPFGFKPRSFDATGGVKVLSGRFSNLFPLLSRSEPQQKIEELRAQPEVPLLVPEEPLDCKYGDVGERQMLMHVLTPLYLPPMVHQVTVAVPLCEYIEANYERTTAIAPVSGYAIWTRRP